MAHKRRTRTVPDYPNVKNAHIVPRMYLERWAIDGKIAVWLVRERKRLEDQAVENVGTRRRFYRRKRPDGSDINDIEWSLSEIEATPPRCFGRSRPTGPCRETTS